jgi:hypothetical protein
MSDADSLHRALPVPLTAGAGRVSTLDQLADIPEEEIWLQTATGHRDRSTTKLYDRRGYNPEKASSFFATY